MLQVLNLVTFVVGQYKFPICGLGGWCQLSCLDRHSWRCRGWGSLSFWSGCRQSGFATQYHIITLVNIFLLFSGLFF